MFHCFTVTICRINTSNALWFSDTQWQQLRQWWGSKMPLNHVEPFHFATQLLTAWKDLVQTLHLPRQLQKVATPAGSQALRISRYGIQKFNVSTCFNMFQWFSMYVSLAPGGMLRFRVPLCSAGTTGWWWAWVMSKIPWGKVQTWVLEGW